MSDQLVTAKVFSSVIDANLAKTVLESEGIFCAVFKDDAGGMEPNLQITRGVQLKVRASDLDRATSLLEE